jgi:hypothetical protein
MEGCFDLLLKDLQVVACRFGPLRVLDNVLEDRVCRFHGWCNTNSVHPHDRQESVLDQGSMTQSFDQWTKVVLPEIYVLFCEK